MISFESILDAKRAIHGIARETNLLSAPLLNPGFSLYVKPENLQYTGSFKMRGATNKISKLTDAQRKSGVVTASAGNTAQAVALGASRSSIPATVVMPKAAPLAKVNATRAYGAKVELYGDVFDDCMRRAMEISESTGASFIHAFDDPDIIAGQGTIGLEILAQLPEVDAVIVPIGGGGLISGIASAIKHEKPSCKVYGVHPENCTAMLTSLANNRIEDVDFKPTIADGVIVKKPSPNTFEICSRLLDGIVTVSEDETKCAMLTILEKLKLVTEGSGALPVAAALSGKLDLSGKNVVCVLSGGNIDTAVFMDAISRAREVIKK